MISYMASMNLSLLSCLDSSRSLGSSTHLLCYLLCRFIACIHAANCSLFNRMVLSWFIGLFAASQNFSYITRISFRLNSSSRFIFSKSRNPWFFSVDVAVFFQRSYCFLQTELIFSLIFSISITRFLYSSSSLACLSFRYFLSYSSSSRNVLNFARKSFSSSSCNVSSFFSRFCQSVLLPLYSSRGSLILFYWNKNALYCALSSFSFSVPSWSSGIISI